MSSKEAVHYNFTFCFRNTLYKPGEDPLQGQKDSLQNLPFFMALFVAGIYIFKNLSRLYPDFTLTAIHGLLFICFALNTTTLLKKNYSSILMSKILYVYLIVLSRSLKFLFW